MLQMTLAEVDKASRFNHLQVSLMYTDEVVPDSFGLEPVVRGKRELTEQELAAAAAAESETAPKRGRGRPAKWKVLLKMKSFLAVALACDNLVSSVQN